MISGDTQAENYAGLFQVSSEDAPNIHMMLKEGLHNRSLSILQYLD